MANNNFEWVKPYNDNNLEITEGLGYLSGSAGFPLNWKFDNPNYGRLKRRATYLFTTNDTVYTGEGDSKALINKTATLEQHGLPIFDINTDSFDLYNIVGDLFSPSIVFNLADSSQSSGEISISSAYTNAQYFEISIAPAGSGETWSLGQNEFTQVSWANDDELRPDYFNAVRELTNYRLNAGRPDYYGASGTYLGEDFASQIRASYMFKMVYDDDNDTKISTGSRADIEEYFDSAEGVTSINVSSLNSNLLSFTDNNGTSRTFRDYYNNLLTAGETNKFGFLFYTNVNPLLKGVKFFEKFTSLQDSYYIGVNDMLHFTITITPRGYRLQLNNILQSSTQWGYETCTIDVYIINCPLNPYLYLGSDGELNDYTNYTNIADADGDSEEMSVFSNRGWDITTSGTTEYVGYNE